MSEELTPLFLQFPILPGGRDEIYDTVDLLFINLCLTRTNVSWIENIDWEGNPIEDSEELPGYFKLTTKKSVGRHTVNISYHILNKYKYLVEGRLNGRPNRYGYVNTFNYTKLGILTAMAEK